MTGRRFQVILVIALAVALVLSTMFGLASGRAAHGDPRTVAQTMPAAPAPRPAAGAGTAVAAANPQSAPTNAASEEVDASAGAHAASAGATTVDIAADGFHFVPNQGDGMREFQALGLSQDELGGYDDAVLHEKIILDLSAGMDLRNAALNGLRQVQQPRYVALKRAIVLSTIFSDDDRAYAMQHLCLGCQTLDDGDAKRRIVIETIGAFTGKDFPLSVQREALFGLAKIAQTRDYALSLLEQRIEAGEERRFADLYVRICDEENLEPKLVLRPKLGLVPPTGNARSANDDRDRSF